MIKTRAEYIEHLNITIIFEDKYSIENGCGATTEGSLISTLIVGQYHGRPSDIETRLYVGQLEIEY